MRRHIQANRASLVLTLLCGLGIIFAMSTYVNAQESDESLRASLEEKRTSYEEVRDTIGERREEIDTKVTSTADEFKKKIAERRTALVGRVKERVHNLFDNVTMRLDALVLRFEQISVRLESRIAKSKASGMNTAEAETAMSQARAVFTHARESLEGLKKIDLDAVVDAESPTEKFLSVRATILGIREVLRQTHTALLRVAALLRNTTPSATVTTETELTATTSTSTLSN